LSFRYNVADADARPGRQGDSADRQGIQASDEHHRALERTGTMDEEFLFWDNATYMMQIGLGQ